MLTSPTQNKRKKEIGGYNTWDVEEAVNTLKHADEIKADSKFLAVVIGEMDRESDKLEKSAKLLKKVGKKLKSIRKENK